MPSLRTFREPTTTSQVVPDSHPIFHLSPWSKKRGPLHRNPDEFVQHWNPYEPKRLFWIDDAFGATQFDWSKASEWNHTFPQLNAAVRGGAKIVFTSRDFIFRAARPHLKTSAFPPLENSQVIIQVENLTKSEREQILYNHIKLGRQSMKFKSAVKPHLTQIAANPRFKPEAARRLGEPLFTKRLDVTLSAIQEFVDHPLEHLKEVISTLDAGSKAALAMIFMRGGALPCPLELISEELRAAELIGGNISEIQESLSALNESLVLRVMDEGAYSWRFRHPTIQDAFASLISEDVGWLDIYLAGTLPDRLLDEVSCGQLNIQGVKVVLPRDRYVSFIQRLDALDVTKERDRSKLHRFLAHRCEREFLVMYLDKHMPTITSMGVCSFLVADSRATLLSHLHSIGLLPEDSRKRVVATISKLAVETPDSGFLAPRLRAMFTESEFFVAVASVRERLLPELTSAVDEWRDSYSFSGDEDPEGFFDPLSSTLRDYRKLYEDDSQAVAWLIDAECQIEETVESLRESNASEQGDEYYDDDERPEFRNVDRSIFDDVDQ